MDMVGAERWARGLAAAVVFVAAAGSARAQGTADPNPGALTFTGNVDVASVYVFRGIVQEADPMVTLFPSADLAIALSRSVGVNVGTWHSLQTGSAGTNGPTGRLHYEEDFYATLGLGLPGGLTLGTTYTAYTSPNAMFNTVQEVSLKLAKAHRFNPYGLVAFELKGAADGIDDGSGTYLELGMAPSVSLLGSKASLSAPVKLGVSLNHYYQGFDGDHRFGFVDVGGLVTFPLAVPSRFGTWNVHGGADVFVFGDTTRAFNAGDRSKIVGLAGIGVTY